MLQCKDNHVLKAAIFMLAMIFALGFATSASAQLTTTFELDGNAINDPGTAGDDWDSLYYGAGNAAIFTGILEDSAETDTTRFTGGSKDVLDLNLWAWDKHKSSDKTQLNNGYAALYEGSFYLYFGCDRHAQNGDAQIGFWLFQNAIALNPDGTFDGLHAWGDILILSDFTQGGGISTIRVFKWVGSGGSHGSLDSLAVSPVTAYAIVNPTDTIAPWPYRPKFGTYKIFPTGGFFEGGLDLGALGLGEVCFSKFLVETRSSQSVTAELKDFILGDFPTYPVASVNSDTVCEGDSAQLCATVEGGIGPFTYLWSNGYTRNERLFLDRPRWIQCQHPVYRTDWCSRIL